MNPVPSRSNSCLLGFLRQPRCFSKTKVMESADLRQQGKSANGNGSRRKVPKKRMKDGAEAVASHRLPSIQAIDVSVSVFGRWQEPSSAEAGGGSVVSAARSVPAGAFLHRARRLAILGVFTSARTGPETPFHFAHGSGAHEFQENTDVRFQEHLRQGLHAYKLDVLMRGEFVAQRTVDPPRRRRSLRRDATPSVSPTRRTATAPRG